MITKAEKKKYAFVKKIDIDIFMKIKELEKKKLSKKDKEMLKFIKTQMEFDWRKPLVKELKKIEDA